MFGHDVYKTDGQNFNTATKDNNVLSKPHRKNDNVVNRIKGAFGCINKATIKWTLKDVVMFCFSPLQSYISFLKHELKR